jgi:hypothetical protein
MTRLWLLAILSGGVSAYAQGGGEMRVFLTAKDGFLVVHRAELNVSGFAIPKAEIQRTLIQDVNDVLRRTGRLCNQAFKLGPKETCPGEAAAISRLSRTDWTAVRAAWTQWQMSDPERPSIDAVFNDNAPAIVNLGGMLPAQTALMFDANVDTVDTATGSLLFTVMPAVRRWNISSLPQEGTDQVLIVDSAQGPPLVASDDLRAALEPLVGSLWRPPRLQAAVAKFYSPARVLRTLNSEQDIVFSIKADAGLRRIEIREGARLATIEMDENLDPELLQRGWYLLLPYEEFKAARQLRKREYPEGQRPIIGPGIVSRQGELNNTGLAIQGFQPIGGQETLRVMMLSPRSQASTPPRGRTDPVTPEKTSDLPKWIRVEGGLQYRPQQGVRGTGRVSLENVGGPQSFRLSAGGTQAGAAGSLEYNRDFLFFSSLQRRLNISAQGGTDSEFQRILLGVETNERRWSATARANLEWIPDRTGKALSFWSEVERTTIVLKQSDIPDESVEFAALNAGTRFSWRTQNAFTERLVSFSPRVHTALPVTKGFASFTIFSASTSFIQTFGSGFEARVDAAAAAGTADTPLAEQPTLGGADTVRGFRSDDAIGLTVWHAQNELWFSLPFSEQSGLSGWARRNLRPAAFMDVGAIYREAQGTPGLRYGAGGGLRIQATPGVFLKVDYGYGFGVPLQEHRGRIYFGVSVGI